MITKLIRKLMEHAIVPGPGTVHISTYPLMAGGVLKQKASKKEAVSGSAAPQVLRKKESENLPCRVTYEGKDLIFPITSIKINESASKKTSKTVEIRTRFRESDNLTQGTKFKVVLIQEGLGNFKSAFYYTKDCLQQAAQLFEGKKCYADHPTAIEEQVRPERSTRDILGYFEGVTYAEDAQGRGMLEASLCLEPTDSAEWARSLLTNSLEYAKKYTDQDFVGLSINAAGEAEPTGIDEFMKSSDIPESAIPKLVEAKTMGVEQIQVVKALKDAVSCDLVTEAGAGGKILSMIESKRGEAMKQKTENEKKQAGKVPENPGKTGPLPAPGKEAGPADGDAPAPKAKAPKDGAGAGDDAGHDDADQDKALFAKMIKQYLGDDADQSDEAMKMAKHAYQAHKEGGMDHEAAYEAAGNHLKMSMAIGKKMAQDEAEAEEAGAPKDGDAPAAPAPKEDEAEAEEDECKQGEKKESACKGCVEKSAQLSKVKESLRVFELAQYLEKKCAESKLPMSFTKEARAALGTPKTKKDIDFVLETFKRAHKASFSEGAGFESCLFPEKQSFVESDAKAKLGTFADCANS